MVTYHIPLISLHWFLNVHELLLNWFQTLMNVIFSILKPVLRWLENSSNRIETRLNWSAIFFSVQEMFGKKIRQSCLKVGTENFFLIFSNNLKFLNCSICRNFNFHVIQCAMPNLKIFILTLFTFKITN